MKPPFIRMQLKLFVVPVKNLALDPQAKAQVPPDASSAIESSGRMLPERRL
ncbi:MAG: hypothetical protein NT154_24230 [Verrucomicrobia bacterium]|nr:hypothetical protein [Verrucomicrobiota bacterium]